MSGSFNVHCGAEKRGSKRFTTTFATIDRF